MSDFGKYERDVLTVSEISHLLGSQFYLETFGKTQDSIFDVLSKTHDSETVDQIKAALKEKILAVLPRVIIYESRGAGNVQEDECILLRQLIEEGGQERYVIRVPLPGGRVPEKMHYKVPGGEFPGYNMDASTAKIKAQAVLSIMDTHTGKIPTDQRREFFEKAMYINFGKEFLPAA